MNRKHCPECGAKNSIRKIIYGLPDGPPDESNYLIGGCIVSDNDPTHECIECGWQKKVEKSGRIGLLEI